MYQSLTIVGRLGRDPEMRYTPNGQAVTNFSIATDRQWNDANGQKQKETTWFKISVWGKQAESANQYLHKGSMVLIEGRLVPDPKTGGPKVWESHDGNKGASFEVAAGVVRFLTPKGDAPESGYEGAGAPAASDDIDIPF